MESESLGVSTKKSKYSFESFSRDSKWQLGWESMLSRPLEREWSKRALISPLHLL